MNRSMPGLPVHHQLPEFTQTHVHHVGDAIQPSHPLSSPSPPAPNPSQRLFQALGCPKLGQEDPDSQPCGFHLRYAMAPMRHQPGSGSAGHGAAPLRGRASRECGHRRAPSAQWWVSFHPHNNQGTAHGTPPTGKEAETQEGHRASG